MGVMHPALHAQKVSVVFQGLIALEQVDLTILPGEIRGLIGPNGAGKTTLINVLTRFQKVTEGATLLNEQLLDRYKPNDIRRMGVARTFQAGRLFKDLAVIENLEITGVGLGFNRAQSAAEAHRILRWMGIDSLANHLARSLAYTDERRVAIGRALMFSPQYLLLDEPAAGMSAVEADELAALVRLIASEIGCGVLLIEHNIGLVLDLCSHIYVLDSGRVVEQGNPQHIRSSEIVQQAYMGTAGEGH